MIRSPARLMEVFPETIIAAVALDAIRLGAISFDAVKQLTIANMARRPAKLDLCDYPYARRQRQDTMPFVFEPPVPRAPAARSVGQEAGPFGLRKKQG